MPMMRINDNLELHYEEMGAGRPIVFVHGVWMSGRYFHKQLPALGQNYHAIALDLRGTANPPTARTATPWRSMPRICAPS